MNTPNPPLPSIACLHTHPSNIAVFESAAADLGLLPGTLQHYVRADLLAEVEREGSLTIGLRVETRATLWALATQARAVVLTCSSLGPVVDELEPGGAVPIVRADAALAAAAVCGGQRVIVLCAAPSTLQPTRLLFERAAHASASNIDVRLVEGAWPLFKAGDLPGYFTCLQQALSAVSGDPAMVIVLAQASMAAAVRHIDPSERPLTSPTVSLQAVLNHLAKRQSIPMPNRRGLGS